MLWCLLLAAAAVSLVRAPFPQQAALQHFPTVVMLIALPVISRRVPLSNLAFTCIVAFMLLHVLGARYIYSYVPYDEWSQRLFGVNITRRFGLRRNHYDRVVHFFFGALWVRPVFEVVTRRFGVPRRFAYYAAFEFVLAYSMLYELFEWGLTMVLSPADAGAYNGEQGDIWDSQKDMSCAVVGALVGFAAWAASAAMARRRTTSHYAG
jgi:putative membrane protein